MRRAGGVRRTAASTFACASFCLVSSDPILFCEVHQAHDPHQAHDRWLSHSTSLAVTLSSVLTHIGRSRGIPCIWPCHAEIRCFASAKRAAASAAPSGSPWPISGGWTGCPTLLLSPEYSDASEAVCSDERAAPRQRQKLQPASRPFLPLLSESRRWPPTLSVLHSATRQATINADRSILAVPVRILVTFAVLHI